MSLLCRSTSLGDTCPDHPEFRILSFLQTLLPGEFLIFKIPLKQALMQFLKSY